MKIPKIKLKRGIVNRNIRLGILAIVGLLVILSAYSAIGAYQEPTTIEETQKIPTLSYAHSGTYDFNVYLISNTLFEDETVLKPGEATIFIKLIDHIDAKYTYIFQSDKQATVEGTYKLEAQIQTDQWSKTYTLTPETAFDGNKYTNFTIDFPFNTSEYEQIVQKINEETGVVALNPTLILKCTVLTNAETSYGEIREAFIQTIQIPLGGNVLEFQGDLSTKQLGALETTQTITKTVDTSSQRNTWTIATILFSLIFILLVLFTTSEITRETVADKMYRKIQKKYGDWIVEAEELPTTDAKIISMKSFDDLIKISEELGKPVIHYKTTTTNPGETHTFYVFDEGIHYKHVLPTGETITKIAKCPRCGQKIKCEGILGKTVSVTCPSCDNSGKVTLTKTSKKNPFKRLFATKI